MVFAWGRFSTGWQGVVAVYHATVRGGHRYHGWAEQSPAPTEGLRFFTGLCLSPPHPSRPEAVTPSPQGEGGADRVVRPYGGVSMPCIIHAAAVVGGCYRIRRTGVVAPYGGKRCRLPFGRRRGSIAAGLAGHIGPALRRGVVAVCHSTGLGGVWVRAAERQ